MKRRGILSRLIPYWLIPVEYRKDSLTVTHQVGYAYEADKAANEIELTEKESEGLLQLVNEKVLVREAVKKKRRGEFDHADHPLNGLTVKEIRHAYKHGWYVLRKVSVSSIHTEDEVTDK